MSCALPPPGERRQGAARAGARRLGLAPQGRDPEGRRRTSLVGLDLQHVPHADVLRLHLRRQPQLLVAHEHPSIALARAVDNYQSYQGPYACGA